MPVRNEHKGATAVAKITAQVPAAKVSARRLDLSSLKSSSVVCASPPDLGGPSDSGCSL